MQFKFTTAGESHGKALVAIVEGLPSGLDVDIAQINHELWRRQQGYGRGGRMKIENDTVEILSGIRQGKTLGSPIALLIENTDFANWQDVMRVESSPPYGGGVDAAKKADGVVHSTSAENHPAAEAAPLLRKEGSFLQKPARSKGEAGAREIKHPRPGHADLAGGQKFQARDLRNILERASARETAARVACGAIAKQLLAEFGVEIKSHVIQLGGIPETPLEKTWDEIAAIEFPPPRPRNAATPPQTRRGAFSQLNCADKEAEAEMIKAIDQAKADGDTLGGVFEIIAKGIIPGLGSHTSWSEKLDGRIAQSIMSIHAVKAVEIGTGIANAAKRGSEVHDEIFFEPQRRGDAEIEKSTELSLPEIRNPQSAIRNRFVRKTNRAGGLEGGITNGEEIRVRGYMKPLSTLRKPLRSVDIDTKEESLAAFERSDITAVPAAGVIGEAMLAIVLTNEMREKFGGDSIEEMKRNFESYKDSIRNY